MNPKKARRRRDRDIPRGKKGGRGIGKTRLWTRDVRLTSQPNRIGRGQERNSNTDRRDVVRRWKSKVKEGKKRGKQKKVGLMPQKRPPA